MSALEDPFGAENEAFSRWDAPPENDPAHLFKSEMPLIDPAEWEGGEPPAREWALENWIPAQQATYITGPGSAGKSLISQQLCTCIALGLPFMGVETRQAVSLYLTCEDDAAELRRRQHAICAALGVKLADLSGKLFLVSRAGRTGNELATFADRIEVDEFGIASPLLRTTPQWTALAGTAQALGVQFVALDNVAHLFAGNENIRNEVAAFVSLMNRLAAFIGGAVLFLGHPNKAGADYSGSTAWENQVRSRLYLEKPEAELDCDVRELSIGKANYAANGAKLRFRWHRGAFIRDEELPESYREQLTATIQASHDNEVFLQCLDTRNAQERPVSESRASRTYAPKEFALMAESKDIGRARLEAALDRLFRAGEIERGFVCRSDRKDREGLRRKCADLRADPAPTGCADVR